MSEVFKSSLFKSRYRFALFAIALMSLMAFLTMKVMLNSQDKYAEIINISGRYLLKQTQFDFILCDIQMPVMNGVAFLKNLIF